MRQISPAERAVGEAAQAGSIAHLSAEDIENMEIGHNVMHGQWDWMRDSKIHSSTWEWDNASPSDLWKQSHNELHHTYSNSSARTGGRVIRVGARTVNAALVRTS